MLTVILAAIDHCYSSADFWAGIGTAIAVFGIIVTIWLWRLGSPRAVLYF